MAKVSDKGENRKEVQAGEQTQPGLLIFDFASKTIRTSYTVSVINMVTPLLST